MRSTWGLLRSVAQGFFIPICLILVLQVAAPHMISIRERELALPELHKVPLKIERWQAPSENTLEAGVTAYLKPDEYILRDYLDESKSVTINLFVAYFKTLLSSWGPHSPRVCLPGAGWLVRSSKTALIDVGRGQKIPVNEYVLEKSGQNILVVYWYQNERNIWAEEFSGKLRFLQDLMRYHRSDLSLIRLVVPMRETTGNDERAECIEFTHAMFPRLVERFEATQ